MKTSYISRSNPQTGFTIVELMIATLIFAVILIVVTTGVIKFSNDYYKGVNSSTTQNTTRSVMDTLGQAIQFAGSAPSNGVTLSGQPYWCIGNQQFVYDPLGQEVTGSANGIVHYSGVQCSNDTSTLSGGRQLLQDHMHLANFAINPSPAEPVWTIKLTIAYAPNDSLNSNTLLCSPAIGNCDSNAALTNAQIATADDLRCKIRQGSQFCAVSSLSTTVVRRVNLTL